jgi:hypothetical protein
VLSRDGETASLLVGSRLMLFLDLVPSSYKSNLRRDEDYYCNISQRHYYGSVKVFIHVRHGTAHKHYGVDFLSSWPLP